MEYKPIQFKCPCCSAVVLIHPTHPKYHEYRMELVREAHPDVADDEPLQERRIHEMCEHLSPNQAEETLRKRFISPEGAETEEEM